MGARQALKPGEQILGDGVKPEETVARGICNAPMILQKVKEIDYKVPEGAKRVPWVDTLDISGHQGVPKGVSAKDGVKLENTFLKIAADAAKEAYRRLRVMKIPCTRPDDFYAEMMRPDSTMLKVRERATEEQRRIKIVEDRKKAKAGKKFAKKAKAKKMEARADEKRKTLEGINEWQKKNKQKNNVDDQDLEDVLNRSSVKQG